jgi:hypothetical protein
VTALSLGLMAGCGSSSSGPGGLSAAPGSGGGMMTTSVDRSRCDDRGKQVIAADTNGDNKADVLKLYVSAGKGDQSGQTLVCKQVDLNGDNKVDIVYHYGDEGTLNFEEFDLDFDGRFDLRAFYQAGRKVREELDTNYDQKVDFTKYYEADKLVRVERDANNDGKVDEWQYYEAGKLDRIGFDSTGSGKVDRWERAPEEAGGSEPAAPPLRPPRLRRPPHLRPPARRPPPRRLRTDTTANGAVCVSVGAPVRELRLCFVAALTGRKRDNRRESCRRC